MMSNDSKTRPLIEWIFGGISAAIVAMVILYLGYEAVFGDSEPPDFAVTIDRLEEVESGTLVMVTVANKGDRSAAEITVQAGIAPDGVEPSTKEIRFDFIAAHSMRKGAFIVEDGPVDEESLTFTVQGYVEP